MSDVTIKILQQLRDDIAQLAANANARFDRMESRFDALDLKVSSHGARLEHIEGAIVAILHLIGTMNDRLDSHETLLSQRGT